MGKNFEYNKLNFHQLFDVTFELEGTRKLPLSTEQRKKRKWQQEHWSCCLLWKFSSKGIHKVRLALRKYFLLQVKLLLKKNSVVY